MECPWDPDAIATTTKSKNDVNYLHPNVSIY
jgi:hypothetical protein